MGLAVTSTRARTAKRGPTSGFSLGILALDTRHQLVPGNVQHAGSYAFPVLYEIVKDVSGSALMRGDPNAAGPIVRGCEAFN